MNPYDDARPPFHDEQDPLGAHASTSTVGPAPSYDSGNYAHVPTESVSYPQAAANGGNYPHVPANSERYAQVPSESENYAQAAANSGSYPYVSTGGPPPQFGKVTPVAGKPRGPRASALFLLTVVIALVFGVGLFSGWQFSRSSGAVLNAPGVQSTPQAVPTLAPALSNIEAQREAVIKNVSPAVVQVNVTLAGGSGIGSGVIIDKRGYIVTNNHVVQDAQTIEVVLYDGTRLPAQLVGNDPADDLAVLKINPPASNLTVITLGDSSKLQVGQDVLAIGNPLGITQTVTNGIISALGRNVNEQNGAVIPNAIQTDAPINPGNSGGALVDLLGNLIGIPTLTAIDPEFNTPANGVGFAIPSNRVKFIISQIISTGKVAHTGRAALGIHTADVNPFLAAQDSLSVDHGVLIVSVVPGGPADQAHLQAGDVIVAINNQSITDFSTLADALISKNPGDSVSVQVYRGTQQLTINVKLGELQVN